MAKRRVPAGSAASVARNRGFRRIGTKSRTHSILSMIKDRARNRDQIRIDDCIDDVDRASNSIGQFFRHNAMHDGRTPMVLDAFGRCAMCVKLGWWRPDA
jgi:hypothetical protein